MTVASVSHDLGKHYSRRPIVLFGHQISNSTLVQDEMASALAARIGQTAMRMIEKI
jgi:hypothetical protein